MGPHLQPHLQPNFPWKIEGKSRRAAGFCQAILSQSFDKPSSRDGKTNL